ncbi:MAG TPA: hypothetical protein DDW49_03390 [Deltaproteobacteria bacterium]|nr:hypothetical protein [Deltaproteobacteria bacterium]
MGDLKAKLTPKVDLKPKRKRGKIFQFLKIVDNLPDGWDIHREILSNNLFRYLGGAKSNANVRISSKPLPKGSSTQAMPGRKWTISAKKKSNWSWNWLA